MLSLTNDILDMAKIESGEMILQPEVVFHEEFLKSIKPKIALIGVGRKNKFGHPNQEVLERLKEKGIQIYRTDQNGEIQIIVKNNLKIKTFLSY